MKLSQKGFLHLQTIVAFVLVVGVIGGVGAYVLSKSKAATPASPYINGSLLVSASDYKIYYQNSATRTNVNSAVQAFMSKASTIDNFCTSQNGKRFGVANLYSSGGDSVQDILADGTGQRTLFNFGSTFEQTKQLNECFYSMNNSIVYVNVSVNNTAKNKRVYKVDATNRTGTEFLSNSSINYRACSLGENGALIYKQNPVTSSASTSWGVATSPTSRKPLFNTVMQSAYGVACVYGSPYSNRVVFQSYSSTQRSYVFRSTLYDGTGAVDYIPASGWGYAYDMALSPDGKVVAILEVNDSRKKRILKLNVSTMKVVTSYSVPDSTRTIVGFLPKQ